MIDFEKFPLIQELTKKARAEGIAEGITEGITEGIAKGRMEDLMKIIETEYGKNGLRQVEGQIRTIRDENKLFTLIEPALISSSFEEFKRTLANI